MNKPQLAFAWLGDGAALASLWSAMKTTVIGAKPPKELMPFPSIYAAESEAWSYRFSRCASLADLLHMRVHARRHSGVLWCRTASKPLTQEELEMICYAMGCRLPLVVLVHGLTEATEPADLFEQEARSLVADLGGDADEALFIYAVTSPQETLRRAYQRLDDSLTAPPLMPPPEAFIKKSVADLLLFFAYDPMPDPAPQKIEVVLQEKIAKNLYSLLNPEQRAISSSVILLRQYQARGFHALGVRATFDATVAFPSDKALNATLHTQRGQALDCRCFFLS